MPVVQRADDMCCSPRLLSDAEVKSDPPNDLAAGPLLRLSSGTTKGKQIQITPEFTSIAPKTGTMHATYVKSPWPLK